MSLVYDRAADRLVDAAEYRARKAREVAVSPLPFPMVQSDQIEIKSMVDGKTYDSKSELRQSYRRGGYVEVGNEYLKNEPKPPKPKVDRKGIKEAVGKAFARVGIN